LSFISTESGNEYFVVENGFLIDIVNHKWIRDFSNSPSVQIGDDIEIVGSSCFSWCDLIVSLTFESNSRLTRIESEAFNSIEIMIMIIIPSTVLFVAFNAFSDLSYIFISDRDSCPEFDRWKEL
jgi:hypothetical protein